MAASSSTKESSDVSERLGERSRALAFSRRCCCRTPARSPKMALRERPGAGQSCSAPELCMHVHRGGAREKALEWYIHAQAQARVSGRWGRSGRGSGERWLRDRRRRNRRCLGDRRRGVRRQGGRWRGGCHRGEVFDVGVVVVGAAVAEAAGLGVANTDVAATDDMVVAASDAADAVGNFCVRGCVCVWWGLAHC